MQEYKKMLKNMFRFAGRARRREYWVVVVINNAIRCFLLTFMILLATLAGELCFEKNGMSGYVFSPTGTKTGIIMLVLSLLFVVYTSVSELALTVRRYHDAGFPGWAYLLTWLGGFMCGIGSIVHLVICCISSKEDNEYGVNPKAQENNEYIGKAGIVFSIILLLVGFVMQLGSMWLNIEKCGFRVTENSHTKRMVIREQEAKELVDAKVDDPSEEDFYDSLRTINVGSSEVAIIVPEEAEGVYADKNMLAYEEKGIHVQYSDSLCEVEEDVLRLLQDEYDSSIDGDDIVHVMDISACVKPMAIEVGSYDVFYYKLQLKDNISCYYFLVDIGADHYLKVTLFGQTDDFVEEDAACLIRDALYKLHQVW